MGWHIHKREFNAELSKSHFENIKQTILIPLQEFSKNLKYSQNGEQFVFVPSVNSIIRARTLDVHHLTKFEEWQTTGDFDIQLFEDVLENHYPLLSENLNHTKNLAEEYQTNRIHILSEIESKLRKFKEHDYEFVKDLNVIPIPKREIDGFPKHSCNIEHFAWLVYVLKFNKTSSENIVTRRHHDGIVTLGSNDVGEQRVVYPNTENSLGDVKFAWLCLNYVYDDDELNKSIDHNHDLFIELQRKIDDFKLEIDKTLNKVTLRTKKKFFLFSSCNYIKE